MSRKVERQRLLDKDRDLENGVSLDKPINTQDVILGSRGNKDDSDLYDDGLSVVEKQKQRSTLYSLKLFTTVLLFGFIISTNVLFFVGNRVIFYPNPVNSTTTTTSSNSTITPGMMDQFNMKYFIYFSTFDVLLLSYILSVFWVVCIFIQGYLYQLSTMVMSVLGLVYLIAKSSLSIPLLVKSLEGEYVSPDILPPNSTILTNSASRQLTIACLANSIGLVVIYLALNVYPTIVYRVEYNIQAAKDKKKHSDAEAMDSVHNKKKRESRINTSGNAKRLAVLSKPELPLILCGMIALIFSSLSSLAIPAFFGQIVEVLSTTGDINTLNNSTMALVIIFVVGSLATSIRAYLFTLAGQRFVARMRNELFGAIIKQDVSFFDQSRTGELINRLASDTQVLQNTVTVNISMAVRYTIQIIGTIILLFVTNWRLTLVMLAIIPVLAISAVFYGKKVKLLGKEVQEILAKTSTTAEQVISNVRTVKAFAKEEKFVAIYGKDVHESYLLGKTLAIAGGIFSGSVFLIAQLAIVLIVYIGAKQVLNGQTTTGNLTSFLLYTLTVAMALAFVSSLFGDFMQAIGASDRIFELMDKIPSIPMSGGQVFSNPPVGEIELNDITFTYPTKGSQVLKNISLKLQTGTITALVGPSGGGKSTIVSLIERFYDPDSGLITLDGVDIKQIDLKWYRGIIGYVSQEPLLFAGSIRENISFGIENASMEDIVAAAEKANAHQFIEQFENKYDSYVGERGVILSGGQRQRIAIARALLLNPKILLLDEATSALDAESEYLVKEAIDRLMRDRTVLVIAHRLSTVVNATTVLVINQGTISERGTHDELVKNESGIYYNLVKRQLGSN
ncbi:hypothetical protein CYY_003463 [Polysphondylium violaceum]|uniref:ABC transporter B family protein n=1 Tax=Polysphondylium violaceum TaxID=133409 RepID=A0A8J4PXN9_9MYCE|nr:hypothetical protein CYY_003463 [Polysphondylium violaceum]